MSEVALAVFEFALEFALELVFDLLTGSGTPPAETSPDSPSEGASGPEKTHESRG